MPLTTQDVQTLNALKDPINKTVTTAEPIVSNAPTQVGGLSVDDVQNLKSLNTQEFKVSDTGNSVEPVDGWQHSMQTLGKHYNLGIDGLKDSLDGAMVGVGLKTEDEYKKGLVDSGFQTTSQEDDTNTTGFSKFVDIFGGTIAQAIPSLGATLVGAAGGTLALPGVGTVLGAASVMATLSFGHAKADGIRRGEDPLNSEISGLTSGMLNGSLAFVGVGFAGKTAKDIAAEVITSPPFKEAMIQTGTKLALSMGVNLGAAGISSLGDSLIKYMATRASSGAKPFTIDEATKDFGEALKAGAILSGTIGIATEGVALGLAKNASLEARAQYLSEYLKQETAKIHAENEAALMAKHFSESAKESEIKTAPLQGRVEQNNEVDLLKKQIANLEEKLVMTATSEKEPEAVKYDVNKLPNDNYLKPLSTYTDVLYREMNVRNAIELLGGNRVNITQDRIYMANTIDLALGQEGNKGILIKFNAKDLQGQLNREKPTWEFSYKQGQIEVIAKLNEQSKYVNAVEEVTFASDLKVSSVDKAMLQRALKDRGLTEITSNEDGSTTYSKPVELPKQATTKQRLSEAKENLAKVEKESNKEEIANNKEQQTKDDAEALEKAKKQNEEFQDELKRKNLIDEAILAVSIAKGAAKVLLQARKEVPIGPLSPAQEGALRAKIFISRDPNEVFNLVAEITEGLANKLPTSRISGWSGMDLLNHLYTIFQYQTPENMYKLAGKLDATTAVDARDVIQTKLTNKLYGHVQEATGLNRKEVERLAIKAQKTKVTVKATGADGVEHTITLPIGKIQAFLALMKNKNAQAALTNVKEGNNFTLESQLGNKSTEAAFKAALKATDPKTDNFNKMLSGIAKFYEEIGPDLKKFHDERNPDNLLLLQKNYGQQVHREGANEMAPSLSPELPGLDLVPGESKGTGKGNSAPPGIVKPREPLKTRIIAQDAFSSAQNHARKVANYFAFSDPSKVWVDLLGNVTFRHYVSSHFGMNTLKGLETDYEHVVHGSPESLIEVGPIINFLLNAKAIQVLVGNALYAPKHALTVANGLLYKYEGESLPALKIMQAGLDLTLHPSKAKEILGRAEVNIRYTRKDYLATASGSGGLTKAIGATIIPGDKIAVATIVHAIEDFVYEQTGDRELAKAEAAKGIEQVLASNSTAKSTPMSRGLAERYITQFSGPEAVVARNVRTTWRVAANHPTYENLVNAVYTDFVGRTALVLFQIPTLVYVYALANLGPHKQNDEKVKNALWHIANTYITGAQFPLPGLVVPALFTIAVDRVFHQNFYIPEKNVPGLENVANLKKATSEVQNMIRGKEHKTMHNVLEMMINAIQAASLPIPLSQARAAKDILPKK